MKNLFALITILAIANTAQAGLQAGDNLLTLSGTGATTTDQASFSFGGSVQLSHMITNEIEVLVADSPIYSDVNGASWINSVMIGAAFDLNGLELAHNDFIPFIGGGIGYTSGAGDDTGTTNAFAGARYFLDASTFIYGSVGYQWGWNGSESNALAYGVGLGWRW